MHHSFAYLFERFPSFVQMFTLREVIGMVKQGSAPLVYSIREREERPGAPLDTPVPVTFLPDKTDLRAQVRKMAEDKKLPKSLLPSIQQWGDEPDKFRLYEAAWLGPRLRQQGIQHVHAHFAGIAARTCYWLKRFFGLTYSFTGHANDIFRETQGPVSFRCLLKEASFVAVVSDFSRNRLQEKFPDLRTPLFTVYNGIDLARFEPSNPSNAPPHILSVGRLVEKKGFPHLISACARLAQEGIAFKCRIIGDGPLRNELENLISEMQLGQHVSLEGSKSEEEIRSFLANSRLFALACVAEKDGGMDNLPTVITEAMAAGLPVVSTRIAGVPEQIVDSKTGFLCEPENPAALADAIKRCLTDSSLCATLGKAGRLRAMEKFSLEFTVRLLKRHLLQYGRAHLTLQLFLRDKGSLLARSLRPFRFLKN